MTIRNILGVLLGIIGMTAHSAETNDLIREQAHSALKKAATYYHANVASHGGYVYYYSVDLQQRWGEGVATRDQIFVQPPGTPAVGMAYLKAFRATDDRF